jgi:hypothetical protein
LTPSLRTAALRGPTRIGLSKVTKTARGAVVSVEPGGGSMWSGTAWAEALPAVVKESATTRRAVRHTGAEATRW